MATGTWSFLRMLFGVGCLLGSIGFAHATPAADWLQQQSQSTGIYQSDTPLATDLQATSEAVVALEARGLGDASDVALARDYLDSRSAVTTEELARRIRFAASLDEDTGTAIEQLRQHQNRDGGFGDRAGYSSTPLDTAWALEALVLADTDHPDPIGRAVGFLLDQQKAEGGWSAPESATEYYTTALALRALARLRDRFDLDAAIDSAHAYLLNARDSSGAIGTPHETAAAILALAPTSASKTVYSDAVSSLKSRQDTDGSWESSVFATALAIQALALAEQPQPNPELGSLSLRLLDAETGELLDGVEISLSGPEPRAKSTGSDGQVVFRNMEAGEYRIIATTTGYSDLETSARIDGSKRTDLGDIRLFRSTEEDVAHLTGVVTAVDDGSVIAGAEIRVTGDATARAITDETGQFTITGLAVGTVRIEASADGHHDTVIEVSLAAGQTNHVNIPLPSIDDHAFAVSGTITATASAEPIAGATVEVDGAATASTKADQDGKYRLSDLPAGPVTIAASAENFGEVRVGLEAEPGSEYIFSPALPESGSMLPEDDIALSGKVVDAIASMPIPSASVEINTSEGIWTAVTGSGGEFHVDDLTGVDAQIAVSAAGYANGFYSVTLSPGVTLDAGELELVPADNTSVITVSKQVLDSETGDPIEGARVESIYPDFSDAAFTDASGKFSVDVVANREGRFLVTADEYESADFSVYFMSANDQTKTGDIYLRPEGLVALQPDLAIGSIDVSHAETDSDMFLYGGSASIDINNLGGKTVAAPFVVVARDLDGQVLGEATVDVEIPAGGSHTVEVDLNGTVTFRDEPFELILDADSSIPELDEGNNAIDTRERCLDNLAGCPLGKAARVDGWMDVLTAGGHGGSSWWVFHENGRLAELRGNYNPRMLISDFVLEEGVIAGTLETGTNDNDMIGFVWGYQDAQHFYRFRWRKNFPRYMQVHRIDSKKPLFNGVGTDDELLFESVNGWEPNVEYTYFLDVKPGNTRITVFEGDYLVESIKIEDSKYKLGHFGIYNHSQPGSFYRVYPDQDSLGVDLTVGALQVVDRGMGNLPALRARVGNAGGEASPGDVKLQFYSGDPDADGQLLATSTQSTIASGEFVDVLVEDVKGVIVESELFVVVDPDDDVAELREGNNSDWVSGTPASTLGSLEVDTDAGSYRPNAPVEISSTATNSGSFAGNFRVALRAENTAGEVVSDLGETELGTLASGETGNATATWITKDIVAGSYEIVATLFGSDGSVADEVRTNVVLQPTEGDLPAATLRTAPDAAVHGPNDTVAIEHLVRNVSPNAVLSGAELTTVVIDPDGMERSRGSVTLGDLAASAQRERLSSYILDSAPEGTWTVRGVLMDGQGTVLAQDEGHFDVVSGLLDQLSGRVSVTHTQRYVGQPQICSDTLVNEGEVVEVEIRRLVLDRERAVQVHEDTRTVFVDADETRILERSIGTGSFEPGLHTCLLQVEVDGQWVNLDSADFQLDPPPIDIEGMLETGDRGRLLVLLDPPVKEGQKTEDPHGPKHSPSPSDQRRWLEERLDEAGWSYTIVTDGDRFGEELRSAGYAAVALFNEQVKIAEADQRYLTDAVEHDGIGLFVSGMHDRRNGRVESALGLKSKGKLPHVDGLYVHDSEIATADAFEFAIDDKPLRLDLQGARTLADYTENRTDKGKGGKAPGPGLTVYRYGNGHSIDAGFDLLLQGTVVGDDNRYSELLLSALDHIHPDDLIPAAGHVWPLHLVLVNEGLATPGRVALPLPEGVTVVDPGGAIVEDGTLIWPFTLDIDERIERDAWIRLPAQSGPVELQALIQTGTAPDWADHRTVTYTIDVD